uniref:sensor histidine kinase n=1 Tax=Herbidospora sakaeratensis TaxID=564415 RepID=UPI0007824A78|nr:histidine kinase [Herbidospora sakaeratensis]
MKQVRSLGYGLALSALVVVQIPVALVSILGVLVSTVLGMVFLLEPSVRLIRFMAGIDRHLMRRWVGVEIPTPYRPKPPALVRARDGYYHHKGKRYRTATSPHIDRMLAWVITDPATWRELVWIILDPWTRSVLALGPTFVIGWGIWLTLSEGLYWGLALSVAAFFLAPAALKNYGLYALALLGPTANTQLVGQVNRLNQVRADQLDLQAAELRRIERDLHDGAQARMVAVGMTIGAAEQLVDNDPNAAKALLAKARESSATALQELRQLVRGIHPPVLAERGLGDAIRALALDSPLKVKVHADLLERPESPVESAVYFAVSELLTNASRYEASKVTIDISRRGRALRVTVTDDGPGGAKATPGGGLAGIERRLAAFDGVLALSSPPGGGTTATIEVLDALPGDEELEPVNALPKGWRGLVYALCWSLCWLPLFPQGLVATFMLIFQPDERSWFLALYMPPPYQWPTVAFMIALGATMLATGIRLNPTPGKSPGVC